MDYRIVKAEEAYGNPGEIIVDQDRLCGCCGCSEPFSPLFFSNYSDEFECEECWNSNLNDDLPPEALEMADHAQRDAKVRYHSGMIQMILSQPLPNRFEKSDEQKNMIEEQLRLDQLRREETFMKSRREFYPRTVDYQNKSQS